MFQNVSCRTCEDMFTTAAARNSHERTHRKDEKDKKCPYCNYCTIQSSNLKTHIKTIHLTCTLLYMATYGITTLPGRIRASNFPERLLLTHRLIVLIIPKPVPSSFALVSVYFPFPIQLLNRHLGSVTKTHPLFRSLSFNLIDAFLPELTSFL